MAYRTKHRRCLSRFRAVALVTALLPASVVNAQEPPAPDEPAEAAPAEPAPGAAEAQPVEPEPAPAEPEPAPPAAEPIPEYTPRAVEPAAPEAEPFEVPPPAPAVDAPAAAGEETEAWYERLEYRAFVDAYFGLNYDFPKPQIGPQDIVRAYDRANGFAVSWAGIDLSLPAAPVGGTIGLRLGPTAVRYANSCLSEHTDCDSEFGLEYLKQAYVSWRPGGGDLVFDFGKFDTIYGAEVAESQDNINYTRGLLYWLGQPLFHTGLRAGLQATENVEVKAMLVNGWNNTIDNNVGKSFGLQATYRLPSESASSKDLFSASLGYMLGPERDDFTIVTCAPATTFDPNLGCVSDPDSPGGSFLADRADADTKGLRHFIDLVLGISPVEQVDIVLNADYGIDNVRSDVNSDSFDAKTWWGVMLGARYLISEYFAVGGRGEYFNDSDALMIPQSVHGIELSGVELASGTLTLEVIPTRHLIIKLDNRLDWAQKKIFLSPPRDTTGTLITSTLGVVVTTD